MNMPVFQPDFPIHLLKIQGYDTGKETDLQKEAAGG
jgi:hypothetical protein